MPKRSPYSGSGEGKLFVSDLSLGAEVNDIFIIATAQQNQARNGPYWRIEFRDASGSIGGKIWSPLSQTYPELYPGMLVKVKGRVSSYREQLEISIENMHILSDDERSGIDLTQFIASSPLQPEDMIRELLDLADTYLSHWPWHRLIHSLIRDGEISTALRVAPAAKTMHHAYAGGLLEHTLSVARLCMRLADHYPQLDRQVLLAGAICHDLGKLWELSSGLVVEYTQEGKLLGHIFLFLERLTPFIKRSGLDDDLAEHLKHMILSHHGSYEFGSPRLPATPEALALHYADMLDAKLQQVDRILSGLDEQGWSPYVNSLERSLFKAKRSPEKAPQQDIDKLVDEIDAVYAPGEEPEPAAYSQIHEQNGAAAIPPLPPTPAPFAEQAKPPSDQTAKSGSQHQNSHHLPLFSQCSLPSKE